MLQFLLVLLNARILAKYKGPVNGYAYLTNIDNKIASYEAIIEVQYYPSVKIWIHMKFFFAPGSQRNLTGSAIITIERSTFKVSFLAL